MFRFLLMRWVPKLLMSLFLAHGVLQLQDTEGRSHTPLQLGDEKAVVLIFVGVDCPISNSYAPEINRIVRDYSGRGFGFYIVYSDPSLSMADAKKHSADFGYACPSLMDLQQKLMHEVHAALTPQAAVLARDRQVVYLGRIDNWYEDFGKQRYAATTHDLRDALDALVAGKKVSVAVTKAVGCPI